MTAAGARLEAAALLGVDPAAGPAEVQRAFLRAARRVHPDVMPDAGLEQRRAAAAAFDRLTRARDLLLQPADAAPEPTTPQPVPRAPSRNLANSLVVLALLSFLLVLLVTVDDAVRGDPLPGGAPAASAAP